MYEISQLWNRMANEKGKSVKTEYAECISEKLSNDLGRYGYVQAYLWNNISEI
jgi:hypothetical protein